MQTPDTVEGRLTEKIMTGVRRRLPMIGPHEYNRTWEAVFETLAVELPALLEAGKGLTRKEFERARTNKR